MLFEFPQGDIERHGSAESWMAARPNRLNASETAALWGRSRYASRYSLYQDKAHGAAREAEESTHMRRGKIFEGPIIEETRFRYGWKIEQWDQHASVVHPTLPVACTPDCLIVDDDDNQALGQIKLASEWMKKNWTTEPPLEYQIQCQTEMFVTGVEMSYLIVVFGLSSEPEAIPVMRHAGFQRELERQIVEFWDGVKSGREPEVDGSDATMEAIKWRFPVDDGTGIDLTNDCDIWSREMEARKESIKADKMVVDELKAKITSMMGEHAYAQIGDEAYAWKTSKQSRIDSKKIKEMYPDIAKACTKEVNVRTLRKVKSIPDEVFADIDFVAPEALL